MILDLIAHDIQIEERVEIYRSLGVLIDLMAVGNEEATLRVTQTAVDSLFKKGEAETIYLSAIIYGAVIGKNTQTVK